MNTQLTQSDVRPEIQRLANDFFRHLHASGIRNARKMAIDAAVFSEDRARRFEAMMNDDITRPEQYANGALEAARCDFPSGPDRGLQVQRRYH